MGKEFAFDVAVPLMSAPTFTAGSVLTADLSTVGYRAARIIVRRKTSTDTGAAAATIRVLHSDDAGTATTFTTIAPNFSLARATGTLGNIFVLDIDLKGYKKTIKVEYTASTGSAVGVGTNGDNIYCDAWLFRSEGIASNLAGRLSSAYGSGSTIAMLAGGPSTITSLT